MSEPFWAVDTTFYTVINTKIVDSHYLYYLLSQYDFKQLDEGTSIPSLRAETIYGLEVNLPDIETQKKIASFIEKIDGKIEVNQAINDNLGGACFAS